MDGPSTTAINMVAGAVHGRMQGRGVPPIASNGGGVAIRESYSDPTGTKLLDGSGNLVATGLGMTSTMPYWGAPSLLPDTAVGDVWIGRTGP